MVKKIMMSMAVPTTTKAIDDVVKYDKMMLPHELGARNARMPLRKEAKLVNGRRAEAAETIQPETVEDVNATKVREVRRFGDEGARSQGKRNIDSVC